MPPKRNLVVAKKALPGAATPESTPRQKRRKHTRAEADNQATRSHSYNLRPEQGKGLNTRGAHLLDLPTEIHVMILKYALVKKDGITPLVSATRAFEYMQSPKYILPIILINRQLYQAALQIAYRDNTFKFNGLQMLSLFMARIGTSRILSQIKKVELHLDATKGTSMLRDVICVACPKEWKICHTAAGQARKQSMLSNAFAALPNLLTIQVIGKVRIVRHPNSRRWSKHSFSLPHIWAEGRKVRFKLDLPNPAFDISKLGPLKLSLGKRIRHRMLSGMLVDGFVAGLLDKLNEIRARTARLRQETEDRQVVAAAMISMSSGGSQN